MAYIFREKILLARLSRTQVLYLLQKILSYLVCRTCSYYYHDWINYLLFGIGALLANQDNMEFNFKCNAFELYGADFLLSYDLKPWLIEINSSPALGATTAVTNRMCAAMLEDVVR